MKRNRIVINLESPPPRRSASSGCAKVAVVVALILLILAGGLIAGGYFWWRHYQTTPDYTLAVLADAAQRNDSATVDSILDNEKIATDFISQVRQKIPGSSAVSSLWDSQNDSTLKSISTKVKDTIHGQLIQELQDLTAIAKDKPFIVVALAVPRYVDVKRQDQTANATVNLKDEPIKVTMQADGDRWRIVGVQDDKLVGMVADAVVHSAPSTLIQLQDEINKQLEQLKK